MEIYQSVILGMVQGLTELLPISSSAHLNIIPWMFGWINNPGFTEAFEGFDVALHFGTLLAIAIYFFKDWLNLIKGGFDQVVKKKKNCRRQNVLVHSSSNYTRRNNWIYFRQIFGRYLNKTNYNCNSTYCNGNSIIFCG